MGRKHCGKRRNCSSVFSKDLYLQTPKNQGLFGKVKRKKLMPYTIYMTIADSLTSNKTRVQYLQDYSRQNTKWFTFSLKAPLETEIRMRKWG